MTLSVGEHVACRAPIVVATCCGGWTRRAYGTSATTRSMTSRARARLPSPQLVGTPERATLDLNALSAMGVQLVGRLAAVRDGRALFSGGLRNLFALADLKMERLLDTFDDWTRVNACSEEVGESERFEPTRVPESPRLQLDLRSGTIRSIVWATGFRPDYGWLHVPALDDKGHLQHDGGVVSSPGSTPSACRCCDGAGRPSSTAPRTMPGRWSITWPAIFHTALAECEPSMASGTRPSPIT